MSEKQAAFKMSSTHSDYFVSLGKNSHERNCPICTLILTSMSLGKTLIWG